MKRGRIEMKISPRVVEEMSKAVANREHSIQAEV